MITLILKKIVGWIAICLLPLTLFAATQPNVLDTKTTWIGGPVGSAPKTVEGVSLADIKGRAALEAVIYEQPVVYKTEDGTMMYQAYPDYGKSKCGFVHGKTWEEGKLTQSKVIEVCNRNYELPVPYAPHVPVMNLR
jgi:hypothetical protein